MSKRSCVEEIWNNFKEVVSESIERFIPRKILRKNPGREYYSKEVKRLKIKVRKAYNRRKLGEHHQEELQRLSTQLLDCTRDLSRQIQSKEGKCWAEFYKYVKRRKGYRENIPTIEDCNGRLITDPIVKLILLITLILRYSRSKDNIQHIQ